MQVTYEAIRNAAELIRPDVVRTPTNHSRTLSAMTGADIYVKFENLQFTGSFKDRGAANHLRTLSQDERDRGVIALSAGNHAQGVAYHAGRLGVQATIVMPESAPFNKVVNTRALGATVVQSGDTFAQARGKLDELQRLHGYSYVPPFDDRAVIAGQGTVALEMLEDRPDIDVVVVPIGGGGLISGIAIAARAIRDEIEIIGAQSTAFPGVAAAMSKGAIPIVESDETLADGIAVKTPGRITLPIIEELVDDVVVVTEESIERGIALYIEVEKTVAEGAGAASLAAVLDDPARFAGRKVGLVLSGGNIDVRLLASVLMRGLVRTDRVSTLRLKVGDVPGQLAPIVDAIAKAGANIIDIDHHRIFGAVSARAANIEIVIETRTSDHRQQVINALEAIGEEVELVH
ncbi:MAG: threonine ammonia-lyase [Actinomycetia bacterium]|nr:threonine ammonia-lyase [Actinomycetes bacterium]MCP5033562.1 threonine ammonia-lyase [Actinomycetes bacterium]